jgi:CheY-like chemotaxis protein
MESKVSEKKSILIVDDEHANRFYLSSILEDKEYAVETAKSGEDALKIISQEKPDLLLLDIMMPNMNGFDVLKYLKKDNETSDISVIVLTALGKEGNVEKALGLGAIDFLTKPLDEKELFAKIESVLANNNKFKELKEQLKTFKSFVYGQINFYRKHIEAYPLLLQCVVESQEQSDMSLEDMYTNFEQFKFDDIIDFISQLIKLNIEFKIQKSDYQIQHILTKTWAFLSSELKSKSIKLEINNPKHLHIRADRLFVDIAAMCAIKCILMLIPKEDTIEIEISSYNNVSVLSIHNQDNKIEISDLQEKLRNIGNKEGDKTITIYNLSGQSVYKNKLVNTEENYTHYLNIPGLKKGIYIIEIISNNEANKIPVIIE